MKVRFDDGKLGGWEQEFNDVYSIRRLSRTKYEILYYREGISVRVVAIAERMYAQGLVSGQ